MTDTIQTLAARIADIERRLGPPGNITVEAHPNFEAAVDAAGQGEIFSRDVAAIRAGLPRGTPWNIIATHVNRKLEELELEMEQLNSPVGFGNCKALEGMSLLGKVQKCMAAARENEILTAQIAVAQRPLVVTAHMTRAVLEHFCHLQLNQPYSASINEHNLQCMHAALAAVLEKP